MVLQHKLLDYQPDVWIYHQYGRERYRREWDWRRTSSAVGRTPDILNGRNIAVSGACPASGQLQPFEPARRGQHPRDQEAHAAAVKAAEEEWKNARQSGPPAAKTPSRSDSDGNAAPG